MSADDTNYRAFGEIDYENGLPVAQLASSSLKKDNLSSVAEKLHVLRQNILGSHEEFQGPYGTKPIIYSDWTASGRSLHNIEKYIQDHVLKFYGNTHTTSSITGHQSTCFRHESRQIVAEATNAKVCALIACIVIL
jgi:selenocysteine lyase/cysteine desulfurase